MFEMTGIVYTDEDGRTWMWQLDLPASAVQQIETILSEYEHRGCSFECTITEDQEGENHGRYSKKNEQKSKL